jgi:hypothetical protein
MTTKSEIEHLVYEVDYLLKDKWQILNYLRIRHGIWIHILPQDKSSVEIRTTSIYPSHALFLLIIKYEEDGSFKEVLNTSDENGELFMHFDTPKDAYSKAFEFILNNLI